MFIYFWDRERQSASGGGAEGEGDTESETGSRFWAVSTEPDVGLDAMNCEIVTWAKVRRSTDWATQAPLDCTFLVQINWLPLGLCTQSGWWPNPRATARRLPAIISHTSEPICWGIGSSGVISIFFSNQFMSLPPLGNGDNYISGLPGWLQWLISEFRSSTE